ncbi:MAG: di-trans,poly-cis-decaprenylcistransferase [Bacilli bacterium]|nr:di-trans,poly-cis-decaprenylcistransferase [Bacilli bacterium]
MNKNNIEIPNHVAIIMDGNGRWATKRGLKRSEGHLAGSKTLEKTGVHILKKGVKVLSVFAFSTENFKRSSEEVDYLMNLFIDMFTKKVKEFKKNKIKIVFSGRKFPLRDDVLSAMYKIEQETKDNTNGILNICLNYGGQEELIDASCKIAEDYKKGKLDLSTLTKESFAQYLYNDLPPIDLLIRTSGECRVSNFMLYQMAYSEMVFTNTYFPDFDEKEFDTVLDEYQNRNRRFGGN